MARVRLAKLAIIAICMQSMVYGIALLMFGLTMYMMLFRNRMRRCLNYTMITASAVLMLLATLEVSVNAIRVRSGLLARGLSHEGGREGYFADVSERSYIIRGALYNAQTLILDAVVIYRAYVVWRKWKVVLLPAICWVGLLGLQGEMPSAERPTANGPSPGEIYVRIIRPAEQMGGRALSPQNAVRRTTNS
ncbi:hypothetical protein BXZ70DRAFT_1068585 [Cristinia sonorae]|uniref:Uncharacterized protein n=1 Tax=Cristinia sonorae TaxID=1940300 RepID=A0A8K0UDM3_9AGAR|nr:hypothetical protein BXZ70DRAFT_1068585 [Cristinia sonorae]